MVYVIVLNWKGAEDTLACVESLIGLSDVNFKIVVCDNASPDSSYQQILTGLQSSVVFSPYTIVEMSRDQAENNFTVIQNTKVIYFIQTGSNLGYAGGNNVGVRFALNQADMNYVWIINNDTVVDQHSLSRLVSKCDNDSRIGVCGSRLIYFHNSNQLQGMGGVYNKWLATTKHYLAFAPSDVALDDNDVADKIDYIIGASMLIPKRVLLEVGLLCEDYFLYYEEIDFALRLKGKYKIAVSSDSVVYHKEGASTSKGKDIVPDFYSVRNRLLITKKFNRNCLPIIYIRLLLCIAKRLYCRQFTQAINVVKIMLGKKTI